MIQRFILPVVAGVPLVAVALSLLLRGVLESPHGSGVHEPLGYVKTVNLFIEQGWLALNNNRKIIETYRRESTQAPAQSGTSAPAAGQDLAATLTEFADKSYLRDDITAFNDRGDPSRFVVLAGKLREVSPYRHNILLPLTDIGRWEGNLTYRPAGDRVGTLTSDTVRIELVPPEVDLETLDRPTEVDLRGSAKRRVPVRTDKARLRAGDVIIGEVSLVGNHIVVEHKAKGSPVEVVISGSRLTPGERARLDDGDLLKVQWELRDGTTHYALLWVRTSVTNLPISTHRLVNGRLARHPSNPEPAFARGIVAAMDNTSFQLGRDQGRSQMSAGELRRLPLALTLDQGLHSLAQDVLDQKVRDLRTETQDLPRANAITIMDSKSGEILALATSPNPRDYRNVESPPPSYLLRNQNFRTLPIGSVAKPLFAAAILAGNPELANLRIRGHVGSKKSDAKETESNPPFRHILGLRLSRHIKEEAPFSTGQWITFEDFLHRSSNLYATTLLTLAGARPSQDKPQRSSGVYWIGSSKRTLDLDRFVFRTRGTGKAGEFRVGSPGEIETLPFVARLKDLFGIFVQTTGKEWQRFSGRGDDNTDTSLWLPLLEQIYGRENVELRHAFYGVSPEQENIEANLIQNYRGGYLSLILGGATSRWSNIRVAEAFSRLVTGQKVNAQIITPLGEARIEEASANAPRRALPLAPHLRQRLLDALALVVSPGGTGRRLRGRLDKLDQALQKQGEVLAVYAKTGTPSLTEYRETPAVRGLNALIERGALLVGQDFNIHYRGYGKVRMDGREPVGDGGRELLALLQAETKDWDAVQSETGWTSIEQAADLFESIDEHNRSQGNRRDDYFEFDDNNRLLRAQNFETEEDKLKGGNFAIVLAVYDRNARRSKARITSTFAQVAVNEEPLRALTIVINLQNANRRGSRDAVFAAGDLLDNGLESYLLNGW